MTRGPRKEAHDCSYALNTEDRVWMYKRSYNTSHECVHSVKVNIKGDEYEFLQVYWEGKGQHTQHLYGRISMGKSGGLGATLVVRSNKESETGKEYVLVQWIAEHYCGILYSEYDDQQKPQKCELYIWDRGVKEPTKCLELYDKYCKEYERGSPETVYDAKCQSLQGC